MKFSTLAVAFSILALINSYAQKTGQGYLIDPSVNPGGVIDELKLPPPEVEGTNYLYDEWKTGSITLSTGLEIKNYPLKYDIEYNQLEILVKETIKICNERMILKFNLVENSGDTSYFVHSKALKLGSFEYFKDIFQVLSEFKNGTKLLARTYLYEKEPTYVAEMDLGSRNKKLIHKTEYFYYKDTKLNLISSSKKKNKDIFKDQFEDVVRFAKNNRLKFNNREDLIEIFNHYYALL